MDRKAKLRRKKGFTLTETLISLVIFMILAGTASSIIMVSMNLFSRSALKNSAQRVGSELYQLLDNRLTYGKNVTITNSEDTMRANYGASGAGIPSEPMTCVYIPAAGDRVGMGNIIPSNAYVISADEMQGLRAAVTFTEEYSAFPIISLKVEVFTDDGKDLLYSVEGKIRLLNVTENDIFYSGLIPPSGVSNNYQDLYIGFTELA